MFRRKRKIKTNVSQITFDALRKNPGHMFACDQYLAVYWPALDQVLVVWGDFKDASDEELNKALINKVQRIKINKG